MSETYLTEDLLAAIAEYVKFLVNQEKRVSFVYGTFVASETADVNLSQVSVAGIDETQRGIRKLASVTGLVAGDQVLMISGSKSMTIIGKVVGNIMIEL